MLFPISDDDRDLHGIAPVTIGLIVLNIVVFVFFQHIGQNEVFTYGWSVIPYEIWHGEDLVGPHTLNVGGEAVTISQFPGPEPIYLTILSAMFMHADFFHIFSNLLFLWIFGDNVEQRFGFMPFILFYVLSGIVATLVQVWLGPEGIVPNLGASGAISGVLGAYLVLFPRNRVHALFFWFIVSIPAFLAIGVWIILQVISGWGMLIAGGGNSVGGVAYGAHIGGFIAGVLLAIVLRVIIREEPHNPYQQYPVYHKSKRYW